jgi:hypothetical protein
MIKRRGRRTRASAAGLAAALGVACVVSGVVSLVRASSREAGPESAEPGVPVLVELFTSEGCSSCPPADALLIRLDTEPPVPGAQVIVLSEHVDYWDRLGWRDPFSSRTFTERQEAYRQALGEPASYTPQMVVDGRAAFVGSLESEARSTIAQAAASPKAGMHMHQTGVMASDAVALQIRITNLPRLAHSERAELWLAVTETGLVTNVLRGENARRRLRHAAVARRLGRLETLPEVMPTSYETDIAVPLDPSWNRDQLRLVGFIQEATSRRVLGAAQVSLVP